jgi:dTMP kinase
MSGKRRSDQQERGLFITLEGGEGSGKSTQARTLAARLTSAGYQVRLTQEPAGTALGLLVKGIFERRAAQTGREAGDSPPITPRAELFLFAAARADHVRTVIRPALRDGRIVVCDRFADSTLAYQGYGRDLPRAEVRKANDIATSGLTPDLTLLLDLPPETGLARADATHDAGAKHRDALGEESLDFHRRVREGFLAIAHENQDRMVVIDAAQREESVAAAVWAAVESALASGDLKTKAKRAQE